jgi:hypothetical protein
LIFVLSKYLVGPFGLIKSCSAQNLLIEN